MPLLSPPILWDRVFPTRHPLLCTKIKLSKSKKTYLKSKISIYFLQQYYWLSDVCLSLVVRDWSPSSWSTSHWRLLIGPWLTYNYICFVDFSIFVQFFVVDFVIFLIVLLFFQNTKIYRICVLNWNELHMHYF